MNNIPKKIQDLLTLLFRVSWPLGEVLAYFIGQLQQQRDLRNDLATEFVHNRHRTSARLSSVIEGHNYHVLRTANLKDIRPGKWRRRAQAQRTWAKRRPF